MDRRFSPLPGRRKALSRARSIFTKTPTRELAILRLFDGVLDISPHNPGTVVLGNILGYDGNVYLGANNLELGRNNILGFL
ncbi:MAG: hypothetical protein M3Q46_00175, partial [Verrucomicrobiota bacterium]|nr:hypothetical protein [Verrucomicrobiota bacterium]